jgi:hypothetical protein
MYNFSMFQTNDGRGSLSQELCIVFHIFYTIEVTYAKEESVKFARLSIYGSILLSIRCTITLLRTARQGLQNEQWRCSHMLSICRFPASPFKQCLR